MAANRVWRLFRPKNFYTIFIQKTNNNELHGIDSRARLLSTRVREVGKSEEELRVFIVAGEVSGDVIGSRLMASLKLLSSINVRFAGVGGVLMIREGLQSQFPMEDLAVMGIWEVVSHIQKFRVRLQQTTEAALGFQAHVVITIDSKGFSFRLLKQIHARCAQQQVARPLTFHYIAPSFWAWKGGEKRLKGLASIVDHMLCILPFEEEICKTNGLSATFVGHPILEDVVNYHTGEDPEISEWQVRGDGAKFRKEHGFSPGTPIITLLPGSRLQEVDRMLPIFSCTLELLKDTFHDLSAVIPVAPNQKVVNCVRNIVGRWSNPVVLIPGESLEATYSAFDASMVALGTSGTAILQLQLARLPCVVAYRASLLTEWIIQLRTKLCYISLPNILLDSEVLPEALFSACTPRRLASLIRQLAQNENLREQQAVAAEKVFDILSPPMKDLSSVFFQGFKPPRLLQKLRTPTPSMIAAVTVLNSIKWQ